MKARKTKDPHRFSYEGKITWLTIAAAVPAILVALALLWFGDYSAKTQWTLTILIVVAFAAFISSTREHTIRPL
ncbi:MAG: PAS domain-containing sensor histidine kinase, partial [Verrucomicrobia bacterium]|nr:PAS domain-containing sensor histidine kinase [Verrucomicrobiota bacterium]